MRCPSCRTATDLDEGAGVLHEAICPRCHGRLVDEGPAAELVMTELGFSPADVQELAEHFGGRGGACPRCLRELRPMQMRGANVRACLACGSIWFEAGQMAKLSGGRLEEVGARTDPDVAPSSAVGEGSEPSVAPNARKMGAGEAIVMLHEPEQLTVEALEYAMATFGVFRRQDYAPMVERAFGVISRGLGDGFDEGDALRIIERLEERGIGAALGSVAWLRLPFRMRSRRLDLDVEQGVSDESDVSGPEPKVVPFDQYGRPVAKRASELEVAALGLVDGAGGKKSKRRAPMFENQPGPFGWQGSGRPGNIGRLEASLKTSEQQRGVDAAVVLELYFDDGNQRFQLDAQGLSFPHELKRSDARDDDDRLCRLACQIAAAAPNTVWNPGAAETLATGGPSPLDDAALPKRYPSRRAFEREIAWTFWNRRRTSAAS